MARQPLDLIVTYLEQVVRDHRADRIEHTRSADRLREAVSPQHRTEARVELREVAVLYLPRHTHTIYAVLACEVCVCV